MTSAWVLPLRSAPDLVRIMELALRRAFAILGSFLPDLFFFGIGVICVLRAILEVGVPGEASSRAWYSSQVIRTSTTDPTYCCESARAVAFAWVAVSRVHSIMMQQSIAFDGAIEQSTPRNMESTPTR